MLCYVWLQVGWGLFGASIDWHWSTRVSQLYVPQTDEKRGKRRK